MCLKSRVSNLGFQSVNTTHEWNNSLGIGTTLCVIFTFRVIWKYYIVTLPFWLITFVWLPRHQTVRIYAVQNIWVTHNPRRKYTASYILYIYIYIYIYMLIALAYPTIFQELQKYLTSCVWRAAAHRQPTKLNYKYYITYFMLYHIYNFIEINLG